LARDIGLALGTVAHLATLQRTAVGGFTLANSTALDGLTHEGIAALLLPNRVAVAGWPSQVVTAAEIARLYNGLPIAGAHPGGSRVALVDASGELLAIALQRDETQVYPTKVFRWDVAS
jgi:tRNA pseudouridine55 synthase